MRIETIYTVLFIIFGAIVVPWSIVIIIEAIDKIIYIVTAKVHGLKHSRWKREQLKRSQAEHAELEFWIMQKHPGSLKEFKQHFDKVYKPSK